MDILILLIVSHYLCDYTFQSDFVAKYKNRIVNNKYNPMWFSVLLSHSITHGFGVWLVTGSFTLFFLQVFSHFCIDALKCNQEISFNIDQSLHLVVMLLSFVIYKLFLL